MMWRRRTLPNGPYFSQGDQGRPREPALSGGGEDVSDEIASDGDRDVFREARRHLLTGQVISQPHLMGLKLTSLFSVPRELAAWGRWHATASHRRHAARARLRAAWLLWPAYGRPCRTLRRLSAPNKSQDLGASAVFGKVGGENRAWRKDRTVNHNFLA